MVYVDTSALAKWYLNEPRSEDFAAWMQDADDPHISTLTVLEIRCLLARRRRTREISRRIEQRVAAALDADVAHGFLTLWALDDQHVRGGLALLNLLATHPLRTLDAVHLSIARAIGADSLAAADRILIDAASSLGLSVTRFD